MAGWACVGGWRSWGLDFECREGVISTSTFTYTYTSFCGWCCVAWRWAIHIYEATMRLHIDIDIMQAGSKRRRGEARGGNELKSHVIALFVVVHGLSCSVLFRPTVFLPHHHVSV
jgi:hypothetical protein